MTHKNARNAVGLAAIVNLVVSVVNVSVPSLVLGVALVGVFFLVGDGDD